MAVFWVKKANMREVIYNTIKPLSLEKEVLTHVLSINTIKHKATPFFKLPHIAYSITELLHNVLFTPKKEEEEEEEEEEGEEDEVNGYGEKGSKF